MNRHLRHSLTVAAVLLSTSLIAQQHNFKPQAGYVPDSEVAVKIAVAVWEPIYGKEKIAKQAPYRASLASGVWTVEGSLPKGMIGGVATADISKDDGRILRVSHGM